MDAKLPIPSRTRPRSATTPMVLRLKTWESRSPPDLTGNKPSLKRCQNNGTAVPKTAAKNQRDGTDAGWSSPVARQAHNLKVTGSNPVPATKFLRVIKRLSAALRGGLRVSKTRGSTVEARGREVLGTKGRAALARDCQMSCAVPIAKSVWRSTFGPISFEFLK